MEAIIQEVNVSFVATQGLTALVGEQQKSLDELKRTLLDYCVEDLFLTTNPIDLIFYMMALLFQKKIKLH